MLFYQQLILLSFVVYSFLGLFLGIYQSKTKENPTGPCHLFLLNGAFVWADAVVFGLFWSLVSIIIYFLQDWILFLLIYSLFWVVRSGGEIIYWLNQQFSKIKRNSSKQYFFYPIFKDDYTIWFVWQIYWQCLLVISLIFSLYFAHLWLKSI